MSAIDCEMPSFGYMDTDKIAMNGENIGRFFSCEPLWATSCSQMRGSQFVVLELVIDGLIKLIKIY